MKKIFIILAVLIIVCIGVEVFSPCVTAYQRGLNGSFYVEMTSNDNTKKPLDGYKLFLGDTPCINEDGSFPTSKDGRLNIKVPARLYDGSFSWKNIFGNKNRKIYSLRYNDEVLFTFSSSYLDYGNPEEKINPISISLTVKESDIKNNL